MGAIGSLSGVGGGGGGPSSSANASQNFGSDYYGAITPAAPPAQASQSSWMLPAVIGGFGLLAVLILKK